MNPATHVTHVTLPVTIALWSPPAQRARRWVQERVQAAMQWLERRAELRAERRRARAHDALYAALDARTLRDIGLGEFTAHAPDDQRSTWERTLEQRGW